jgi:hypothetical protein
VAAGALLRGSTPHTDGSATRLGDTEIIGYDAAGQLHRTHLFDSYGATTTETLTLHDGMWRWQGEKTRAASVFSDDGRRRPACTSARTTA